MKKTALTTLALLASTPVFGVQIVTNPITGSNPNTANPYTAGQTVVPNLTFSGIGRGAGIGGTNATDRYNANSWDTTGIDLSAYFTFTLTPSAGFELDLTNFVYTGVASPTGPTSFAFRSSVDSFAADIGSPTASGATISLDGVPYQNLTSATEFRLYAWGAIRDTGTFSVNSFDFNGTLSAIPEPTAALLVGLLIAALGLPVARRPAQAA